MKQSISLLFLIFFYINLYAQKVPKASFTGNLNNARLFISDDNNSEEQDSLILILKTQLIVDSLTLNAILSFTDTEKKYEIWKYSRITNNGITNETKMFEVSNNSLEPINDYFQDISLPFSVLKVEVFNQLLFWNGEYEGQSFKSLHAKTRGVFDLLNISKLASELKNQREQYSELLE